MNDRVCSVDGCSHEVLSKGLCNMHYRRLRRTGSVGEPGSRHLASRNTSLTQSELLEQALINRAAWDGQCLLWQGAVSGDGYSRIRIASKNWSVTRLILAEQLGVRLEGLDPKVHALHSCDRGHEGCVTPEHVRPGTNLENVREAVSRGRHNGARTRCPRGHLLVEGNLAPGSLPRRDCWVCSKARSRARFHGTPLGAEIERLLKEQPQLAQIALGK